MFNINNPDYHFSKNLPSNIPKFKDICLPYSVGTRTNPIGFSEDHTCFLCDQNKVGRPRQHGESASKTSENLCSKCFQKCARGISHPCLKSTKTQVENITSTLLQMKPEVHNQVIYKILKSKQDSTIPSTSQKVVSLHTAGTPASVQLNPSSETHNISIPTKTIDEIRSQARLTLN